MTDRRIASGLIVAALVSSAGLGYVAGRSRVAPPDPTTDLKAVELALDAMESSGRSMHERMVDDLMPGSPCRGWIEGALAVGDDRPQ